MKRKFFLILTFFALSFAVHALPGFTPYIQELPGQYVYYEDKTFARKSYFGILQFDEKSFAARYYAPADERDKKPETDVEIYFTIDPKADHMELTGEPPRRWPIHSPGQNRKQTCIQQLPFLPHRHRSELLRPFHLLPPG